MLAGAQVGLVGPPPADVVVEPREHPEGGVHRSGEMPLVGPDEGVLAGRDALRAVVAKDARGLDVRTWQERAPFYAQVRGLYVSIFAFLGAILLVVTSLASTSSLMMTMMERTREMGTLRAMGAGRGVIGGLVVLEALWLGVFGAILGAVIAAGVAWTINASGVTAGFSAVVDAHAEKTASVLFIDGQGSDTFTGGGADPNRSVTPMIFYPNFHSTSDKVFLGTTIPASATVDGPGVRPRLEVHETAWERSAVCGFGTLPFSCVEWHPFPSSTSRTLWMRSAGV